MYSTHSFAVASPSGGSPGTKNATTSNKAAMIPNAAAHVCAFMLSPTFQLRSTRRSDPRKNAPSRGKLQWPTREGPKRWSPLFQVKLEQFVHGRIRYSPDR